MSVRSGMLAPLRYRPFRLLLAGQVVSNLGDWLDYLALVVLVAYTWDKGAAALAAVAIVIAAPWVVVAPFAGVLADRWPRRAALVGCDLARAGIVLGYIIAPNLYVLLALVFAKTVFSTLFNPAQQVTIRTTVPEPQLLAANGLSQLSTQATKVLGPALGGLVLAFSSPRTAFAADAVTFLFSAAILSRLPRLGPPAREEGTETRFWTELRAGFAYIASRPTLRLAIASIAAAVFLVFIFDTLSPLAFKSLGVDPSLLGLVIGAVGLGAVLGTVAIAQWGGTVSPFALMGGAKLAVGSLVCVIGVAAMLELDTVPAVWLPVVLLVGVACAGVLVPYPTILQRETPPELMGRVSATASAVPTVFQLVAPLLGAAFAEWWGVGVALAVGGGGLAVLGLVVLALRPPVGAGPSQPGVEPAPAAGSAIRLEALQGLRVAGLPLSEVTDAQHEVLGALTPEELEVVLSLRRRLDAARPAAGARPGRQEGGMPENDDSSHRRARRRLEHRF